MLIEFSLIANTFIMYIIFGRSILSDRVPERKNS